MSGKGGTGGGGWVHPKGANIMAVYGLSYRNALVGTGRVLFGISGLRNKPSRLVESQFPAIKAHCSATPGWPFPKRLD